jgi:hypothetical protein
MARFRLGAFTGILVAGAAIALTSANCAAPTQIIVDVRTDRPLCESIHVGVAITKPDDVDKEPLAIYEENCQVGTDDIGTLTIVPSGAKDAELAVRIVAGVNGTRANACGLPDSKGNPQWQNCILARRPLKFVPGQTVSITVILSQQCVGQICEGEKECNLGKCVEPEKVNPDGGNAALKDGEAYEDAHPPQPDGSLDASADACAACVGTTGATAACDGVTGKCNVTCNGTACQGQSLCGGKLDCTINCTNADSCKNTQCTTAGSCEFTCSGVGTPRCEGIHCSGGSCKVTCSEADDTCSNVTLDAGANLVSCLPSTNAKATCNGVDCNGGTCVRACNDGGCTGPTTCTGNCTGWEDGGDGGP